MSPANKIPVAGPSITQKEIDYVADAVAHSWYGNANVYQDKFEKAFAEYLGVKHALSLPSCTSAIHLSLLALGIGSGDEVVVPDATWIASVAPVSYVGAIPVFADIQSATWCLAPDSLARCITKRTKAVIAVGLYGNMPDMDGLLAVAAKNGIPVIEDAAEAVGAEYQGGKAGSFGDTGVFSFHGSKTLTTGEGGMIVTNREDLYRRVVFLRDHARAPGEKMFWNTEIGQKYRMSELQAALGLAQLERLEELLERKRDIFGWYRKELSEISGLTLNPEPLAGRNSYWMITVVLDPRFGLKKEALIAELRQNNIDCRPFFYPLSSLPAYARLPQAAEARLRNRVCYATCPYGVNLPSALNLTRSQVVYVCDVLKGILQRRQDHMT
jgi:perosamine synthetase